MISYKPISIGNILCNPGSREPMPGRTGDPTITLIQTDKDILVDPGQNHPHGQIPAAIKLLNAVLPHLHSQKLYVFLTHFHYDHCSLVNALEFAATSPRYNRKFEVIKQTAGEVAEGVRILPTPGHTPEHKSLEFLTTDGRVCIAGDAVLNEAYFRGTNRWNRIYLPNEPTKKDIDLTVKSMEIIRNHADIIVPGHGDAFPVKR